MDKILAIIKQSPTGKRRRYNIHTRYGKDVPLIIVYKDDPDWYERVWKNMFTTRDLVFSYRPQFLNEFHICIQCLRARPLSDARNIFPMVGFVFATPCTACWDKAAEDYKQMPLKRWLMIEAGLTWDVVSVIVPLM